MFLFNDMICYATVTPTGFYEMKNVFVLSSDPAVFQLVEGVGNEHSFGAPPFHSALSKSKTKRNPFSHCQGCTARKRSCS